MSDRANSTRDSALNKAENSTGRLEPIAPGLWSEGEAKNGIAEPHLIGGRHSDGRIIFPLPQGDAAKDIEPYALSRTGTLWSWTRQDFKPKPPYSGPGIFEPYLLGYVELLGEVIVETRIVEARLEDLKLGMAMEFVLAPFDSVRSTYAFRPKET